MNLTTLKEKSFKTILLNIVVMIFAVTACSCNQSQPTGTITPSSSKPNGTTVPTPTAKPVSPILPSPVAPKPGESVVPIPVDGRFTVGLSAIGANTKAGDIFNVDVILNAGAAARGAQCGLTFDPKLMKCEAVSEGSFFKDWSKAHDCTTINYPQAKIDNSAGTVSDFGIAVIGSATGGATGSGVFCTYRFTALASGVASPKLTQVLISDENGATAVATIK